MAAQPVQVKKPCENPEAHAAHMEMNGECPWCGAFDANQSEFGSIGADGTIFAANGDVIEYGASF